MWYWDLNTSEHFTCSTKDKSRSPCEAMCRSHRQKCANTYWVHSTAVPPHRLCHVLSSVSLFFIFVWDDVWLHKTLYKNLKCPTSDQPDLNCTITTLDGGCTLITLHERQCTIQQSRKLAILLYIYWFPTWFNTCCRLNQHPSWVLLFHPPHTHRSCII